MRKLLILAAGVAGYVLGARAGRQRYEEMKDQAEKVWSSPSVQHGREEAAAHARQAAAAAGSKAAEAASHAAGAAADKVGEKVSDLRSKDGAP
ncbi:MAG: hypothetical protein PGN07_09035 [Aeromicrobium erythreum]